MTPRCRVCRTPVPAAREAAAELDNGTAPETLCSAHKPTCGLCNGTGNSATLGTVRCYACGGTGRARAGITGQVERDGEVLLRWNAQSHSLRAPNGPRGEERHYLPCWRCGSVKPVPTNVVSFACDPVACPECEEVHACDEPRCAVARGDA